MRELVLYLCYISIALWLTVLVRNEVAYRNRRRIGNALLRYHFHCIETKQPMLVGYSDCEDYFATMIRIWDFGCTHILPEVEK